MQLIIHKLEQTIIKYVFPSLCFCIFLTSTKAIANDLNIISINAKNESLATIFFEIESQSQFKFFYKNEEIDVDQKITLSLENVAIESLLLKLFEGRAIKYKIKKNKIILKKDSNVVYTIKGQILDKYTGKPIDNVYLVPDKNIINTSNINKGVFEIAFNALPINLTISHINYGKHQINIDQLSDFTISLPPILNVLETVFLASGDKQKKLNEMNTLLKSTNAFNGGQIVIITPTKSGQFSNVNYFWDKEKKEFTILAEVERKQ